MKTPLSGLLFSPNQSLQKYKWQQSFYSSWCSLILVYCCCKAWENVFPHLIFYMCLKIHTGNVKCSDVWKGERKTCFWYFSLSLGKFFEVSFQFAWLWEENQAFNKWKHGICKVFGTKKNRDIQITILTVFFSTVYSLSCSHWCECPRRLCTLFVTCILQIAQGTALERGMWGNIQ